MVRSKQKVKNPNQMPSRKSRRRQGKNPSPPPTTTAELSSSKTIPPDVVSVAPASVVSPPATAVVTHIEGHAVVTKVPIENPTSTPLYSPDFTHNPPTLVALTVGVPSATKAPPPTTTITIPNVIPHSTPMISFGTLPSIAPFPISKPPIVSATNPHLFDLNIDDPGRFADIRFDCKTDQTLDDDLLPFHVTPSGSVSVAQPNAPAGNSSQETIIPESLEPIQEVNVFGKSSGQTAGEAVSTTAKPNLRSFGSGKLPQFPSGIIPPQVRLPTFAARSAPPIMTAATTVSIPAVNVSTPASVSDPENIASTSAVPNPTERGTRMVAS